MARARNTRYLRIEETFSPGGSGDFSGISAC
jgi:hypothetical protein